MLLRNTLAEEGHPVEVPTGVVPRVTRTTEAIQEAAPAEITKVRATFTPEQPAPTPNAHPPTWPLVMVDMASRDNLGRQRYGTPLQPHNGRDTLRDAYEEALDLAVYLRTALYERDGK